MEDIKLITLTNSGGASVVLSPLGAGIIEVNVPDSHGNMADVALGYKNPADYMADGPCAGKVPGRFANRIGAGHFTLDGKEYTLAVNNGPNALHGGPTGFQNRLWTIVEADSRKAVFTYTSADGEEGYPGKLTVTATYTWSDDCVLTLKIEAVTDAPTIINLTNHAYWNLNGHNAGSVLNHKLQLKAAKWLPTDEFLLPTGEIADVTGTPMDFTKPTALAEGNSADFPAIKYGKGYDNCWVIDDHEPGKVQQVAWLSDPVSGRTLTVSTDQPGVQVYAGCWLAGSPANKAGRSYNDYDGVAIECQNFPDAPNKPGFPSPVLRPGEKYTRTISFAFGAE